MPTTPRAQSRSKLVNFGRRWVISAALIGRRRARKGQLRSAEVVTGAPSLEAAAVKEQVPQVPVLRTDGRNELGGLRGAGRLRYLVRARSARACGALP